MANTLFETPVQLKNAAGQVREATSAATLHALNYQGFWPSEQDAPAVAEMVKAAAEPYEPSAHSAAEVNEYLAGADATERERVLKAEAAGKNRTTVVAPA